MSRESRDCPVCGSLEAIRITPPHQSRSMTSDGRVCDAPLEKRSCIACGQGFLDLSITLDREQLFGPDYMLGLADLEAGKARARTYAEQIKNMVGRHRPADRPIDSIVEFGAGTGALLLELARSWPMRKAMGVEPSETLVGAARQHLPSSIEMVTGFAEDIDLYRNDFDLCVSVNVIEHATDPIAFLQACRRAIAENGLAVVICPDGERPNLELLFLDHVSSFTAESLRLAGARAGFELLETSALGGPQAGFRISVLRISTSGIVPEPVRGFPELPNARQRFMDGWRDLEVALTATLKDSSFGIFGVGEFADLFTAYAPAVSNRAEMYVVDSPAEQRRHSRPVLDTETFARHPRVPLIAAIHPRHWPAVKSRLEAMGLTVFHPYQFSDLKGELA